MSKHTPKPWKVIGADKTRLHVRAELRFDVAKVIRLDSLSETEANARLIAAAPDLLEACQKAVKLLEYLHEEHNNTGVTLDEAIAKALGEDGQ